MHNILFSAACSYQIGTGHLIRCLNIARHLVGMVRIFFNIEPDNPSFDMPGIEILDAEKSLEFQPSLVVFDRLKVEPLTILSFKENGAKIILLDSVSCWEMADILINALPNLSDNSPPEGVKVFDGPSYIALNDDLRRAHQGSRRSIQEKVSNILVTAGGSDPYGLTIKMAKALVDLPVSLTFIIGRIFEERDKLEEIIDGKGYLFQDVSLVPYLLEADMALTSFGLTVYEAACLGLPTIMLSPTEDHNRRAEIFARFGSAINLGLNQEVTPSRIREAVEDLRSNPGLRREMARAGMKLVDGEGARRVARIIMDLIDHR